MKFQPVSLWLAENGRISSTKSRTSCQHPLREGCGTAFFPHRAIANSSSVVAFRNGISPPPFSRQISKHSSNKAILFAVNLFFSLSPRVFSMTRRSPSCEHVTPRLSISFRVSSLQYCGYVFLLSFFFHTNVIPVFFEMGILS